MCIFFQLCIVNLILLIFLCHCVQQHCSWSSRYFLFLNSSFNNFCNKESHINTCPIQLFCRFLKVSSKQRLSSTVPNVCSFDACCGVQRIFIIRRQIHTSWLRVWSSNHYTTTLSRVYTRAPCCRATKLLPVCCWIQSRPWHKWIVIMLPRYRQHVARTSSLLLVRTTCCPGCKRGFRRHDK